MFIICTTVVVAVVILVFVNAFKINNNSIIQSSPNAIRFPFAWPCVNGIVILSTMNEERMMTMTKKGPKWMCIYFSFDWICINNNSLKRLILWTEAIYTKYSVLSFSSSNIRIDLIYQCSHEPGVFVSLLICSHQIDLFCFFFYFFPIHSIEFEWNPRRIDGHSLSLSYTITYNRIWDSKHIWFEFQIGYIFGFDLIQTVAWPSMHIRLSYGKPIMYKHRRDEWYRVMTQPMEKHK